LNVQNSKKSPQTAATLYINQIDLIYKPKFPPLYISYLS